MLGIDLDLAQIHHASTPTVPIGAASIWPWLRVAALCAEVPSDNLVVVQRVEIFEGADGGEGGGQWLCRLLCGYAVLWALFVPSNNTCKIRRN